MTDVWSERAQAYRESEAHRSGPDLDLLVEWASGAATALDVGSGGGHVARRLRRAGLEVVGTDPALGEMARVARGRGLVVDNLFAGERAEEADRVRDPSHVRNYSEAEWRELLEAAGLAIEDVRVLGTPLRVGRWLERSGCAGAEADRVRQLLDDRSEDDAIVLPRVALRAGKEGA